MKFLIVALIYCLVTVVTGEQCIVTEFEQVSEAIENCQEIIISDLQVPGGEQLSLHLNEGTSLTFRGTTTFGFYEWTGPLVSLTGVNVTIKGEKGSILDGQGNLYWDGQGTHLNNNKPRFFRISIDNGLLEDVRVKNCPVLCILIRNSNNLVVRGWNIDNLEGKNVTVKNIFCHGSHGLSIRGVGAVLEDVWFSDSIMTMCQNGIHVKTATNGGEGLVKNVTYQNITILDSTKYGINIQQNYPENGAPSNAIPITDLHLYNIYGNVVDGAIPLYIMCAEDGCFDWDFKDVTVLGAEKNNCTNYVPDGFNGCGESQ